MRIHGQLMGDSLPLIELKDEIERVARSDAKVLVTGESGVGKELVAREIHRRSLRASRPFVPVNCAGLPETLLESELFGHVKGSFTGAHRDRLGLLEMANGGTIFLDEIGEMSLRMQALLLRFLENGEIQRVGSDRVQSRVDVRVIAATTRTLTRRPSPSAPTFCSSPVSRNRSSRPCIRSVISPTSSRNTVPLCAISSLPGLSR